MKLNILTEKVMRTRLELYLGEGSCEDLPDEAHVDLCEQQAKLTHNQDVDELELPCPHGTLAADTSKASKRECELCWEVFKQLTGEQ